MPLTLSIRGLCAIADRTKGNKHYALLLNGQHKHTPLLTAFTASLDVDAMKAKTAWPPDFIGHAAVVASGQLVFQQIAIWRLIDRTVTFPGASGQLKPWFEPDKMIDLANRHPDTKSDKSNKPFGEIQLAAGQPISGKRNELKVTQGKHVVQQKFAVEVLWADLSLEMLNDKKESIVFKDGALVAVTNAAAEMDSKKALMHFEHYYDLVKSIHTNTDIPDKVKVEAPSRTDEVYDCVPPIISPP